MTELLPCPFCGGEAKLMHMDLDSIEEGWKVWGVWCVDDLHAEEHGGYQHGHYIDNYATGAEAIDAWNTRAERTCHAELNESRNAVICSACGSPMVLKGWEEFHDWSRTMRISTFTTYPHCPNCGCKVVGE